MTRDCKHGRLARSCETCEWEARALNAETLAREAGEALEELTHPVNRDCPDSRRRAFAILAKLRAAGLLKGGE